MGYLDNTGHGTGITKQSFDAGATVDVPPKPKSAPCDTILAIVESSSDICSVLPKRANINVYKLKERMFERLVVQRLQCRAVLIL